MSSGKRVAFGEALGDDLIDGGGLRRSETDDRLDNAIHEIKAESERLDKPFMLDLFDNVPSSARGSI